MKVNALITLAGALSASAAVIVPRQALSTVSLPSSSGGNAGSMGSGTQAGASSTTSTAPASVSSGLMGSSSRMSGPQSGSSSMMGGGGMGGSSSASSTMMGGSSSSAAPTSTQSSVSGLPAPGAVPTGTPIQGDYTGQYRPQVHFSPPKGFMNDPNGLFRHPNGTYHLYYQYNPTDVVAGNQHWGHATSDDLYHWVNQPIALFPPNSTSGVFSGSAVIDPNNTSGFFPNNNASNPGVVAIYTLNTPEKQTQEIAYSRDGGYSFTPYANNPVIDIGSNQFRDPKVFWYDPTQTWVMVVAHAQNMTASIYNSPNLKDWTEVSRFSRAGLTGNQWECPNLQPVPIRQRNLQPSAGASSGSSSSSSSASSATGSLARRQASTVASGASSVVSGASSVFNPSSSSAMSSGASPSSTTMSSSSGMSSATSTSTSAMPSSTGGTGAGSNGNGSNGSSSGQDTAWIMAISINPGAPLGGSTTQYFVGDFNGTHFTPFDDSVKLLDFAKDNYAIQWFDNTGNEAISIAWASNWQYTDFVPTADELWRSADALPRDNYLVQVDPIGWVLASEPYNISAVRNSSILPNGSESTSLVNQSVSVDFSNVTSGAVYFSVNISLPSNTPLNDYAALNITLSSAQGNENLTAGYFFGGPNANTTWIDRSGTHGFTGNPFFTSQFSQTSPTVAYNITGVWDRSLFELFIDEGTFAATVDSYPQQPLTNLTLSTAELPQGAQIQASVWALSSVWNNSTSGSNGGNSTGGGAAGGGSNGGSSSMMGSSSSMMGAFSSMAGASSSMMGATSTVGGTSSAPASTTA